MWFKRTYTGTPTINSFNPCLHLHVYLPCCSAPFRPGFLRLVLIPHERLRVLNTKATVNFLYFGRARGFNSRLSYFWWKISYVRGGGVFCFWHWHINKVKLAANCDSVNKINFKKAITEDPRTSTDVLFSHIIIYCLNCFKPIFYKFSKSQSKIYHIQYIS